MNISRRRLVQSAGFLAASSLLAVLGTACGASAPESTPPPATEEPPAVTATASPPTPAITPTPGLTPADERTAVPPRQQVTARFPSLDLGYRPQVALEDWYLDVSGAVRNPVTLTWNDFRALPRVQRVWGFHCVTGWTKLDVAWEGVLLSQVIELVEPTDEVTAVILEGRDEYTSNLIYRDTLVEEVLLADTLEGADLPLEHGGPMRTVVPYLYGWKSCKFLERIRFEVEDEPGYWETRGYNNRGDPWREERFG